MTNTEIARLFRLTATLLEFEEANPFKVRSYQNAAETLKGLGTELSEMSPDERAQTPGLGKNMVQKIGQLMEDGAFDELEQLRADIPVGVVDLLQIKGIGPKKVKTAYEDLGIEGPRQFLKAAESGQLVALKGFGKKTVEKLAGAVRYYLETQQQRRYADAEPIAEGIERMLENMEGLRQQAITGEFRRLAPVITQLEWLLSVEDEASFREALAAQENLQPHPERTEAWQWEEENLPLLLHFATPAEFHARLAQTTGSEEFLALGDGGPQETATEEAWLEQAGLPVVPPFLRETEYADTTPEALSVSLHDLVEEDAQRGTIHAHSTFSDGIHTLEEMARACMALGHEYLVITDHSRAAFYANGLKEEDAERQWKEIDRLNQALAPFRIFKGIEADILSDGRLDYDDDFRAGFEFVVASVHSQLDMDEAKATQRLIRAIEHPHCTLLGHPTGRLLLKRKGYQPDMKKVLDACAANGVVVEINANPQRLDLDWRWVPYAQQKGVQIAINPDAHATGHLSLNRYGFMAARKGALRSDYFFNALGRDQLVEHLRNRNQLS